jgi:hypothetical protein
MGMEKDRKMRSSRGKTSLRMTPRLSEEILMDSKYES